MAGSRILRAILKASKEVGERPATRRAIAEAAERGAAREAAEASARSKPVRQWFDTPEEMDEAIDTAIRMKALEGRNIREAEKLKQRRYTPSWENRAARTADRVFTPNAARMKALEEAGIVHGGVLNQALIQISRRHRGDLRKTAEQFERLLSSYERKLVTGTSAPKRRGITKTEGIK